MIIHLEVEWDDAVLERFALVIAQQSIHFALQLNWILQGALQDYQPELEDGTPNEVYNPRFYTRCLKLLKNVERCVVYGKPRAQELQRLYEKGEITKAEMDLLEQADRRFNALQITSNLDDASRVEGDLDGWLHVQLPKYKQQQQQNASTANSGSSTSENSYVQRYCVLDRHVLNLYTEPQGCSSRALKLDRALALDQAEIAAGSQPMVINIQRPQYEFRIRCASQEECTLWLRRLKEDSYTSALFQSKDSKLRSDLTPQQLDRYNLFQDERQFVYDLTAVAEELRDKDRQQRKALAPGLMQNLKIPDTVYVPLCNSSDIWRRVFCTLPKETRVFNTKERCPTICNFVTKRGESTQKGRIDPNLDVAEFLHMYFDVTAEKEVMEGVAEGTAEEEASTEGGASQPGTPANEEKNNTNGDGIHVSGHGSTHSGAWASDVDDDPQTPAIREAENTAGNVRVQRMLRESIVTLPNMLAKRLKTRSPGPRRASIMDRQTQMQPMVPIIEGRHGEDFDSASNASVGDGTVVSIERSSVLVKDRIVFGDLDEGDIDLESIDRAKQFICGGESWAEKSAHMLEAAVKESEDAGENVQLEISNVMSKSNDDLRQEVFVMQMIHYYKSVFAQAKLPLWLKTYRILSCSSSTGLLEVLVDATSIDALKKSPNYPKEGGLRRYFEIVYGGPDSPAFKAAQTNFMQSLAAYSLVSYLLGLKDRHNGNIMIDTRGHLIHIDFGFAFAMAPGHEFSFERAPFKLTKEYVEVMGGVRSECYKEFQRLFVAGFEECRKNSQIALGLVEIMMYKSNYPCFSGWRYGKGVALRVFEKRLMLRVSDKRVKKKALRLIRKSRGSFGTHLYDAFQKATNGYAI